MTAEQIKTNIKESLSQFGKGNLTETSLNFFENLGYISDKQAPLDSPTFEEFQDNYVGDKNFDIVKAKVNEWKYVDLLFQLSREEVSKQATLFDTKKVDQTIIEAYLFFAIELSNTTYTRTELSIITREINRLFPMPAMILFKHGKTLTLSVINRRLHKRDETKDVLEKVTLIKDINIENPHRAHIEILYDLSFDELRSKYQFTNFVELHNAWQKTLDTKELNKRFYSELFNWYLWAVRSVNFPNDVNDDKDDNVYNSESVIRLLTRLIFVWFIKEKNLVPNSLFEQKKLKDILLGFQPHSMESSVYYRAILQNLFFATLNTPMDKDITEENKDEKRRFINTLPKTGNDQYLDQTKYRYQNHFSKPEKALELFSTIPFLNGGLFECLDFIEINKETGRPKEMRYDGFSSTEKRQAFVPDKLFFADEFILDLNSEYGTKGKKYKVEGLINILDSYKFTITENTPLEEEIALDPELLGKVFENLLASYNPETQTTARKQTGSFYTPREIVNYMVDESLIAYFKQKLDNSEETETNLRDLFSHAFDLPEFTEEETDLFIKAISKAKILDPACGSGAFPMGVLHRLVDLLNKLDPENKRWNELQIQRAIDETAGVYREGNNSEERKLRLDEIEKAFDLSMNYPDYARKLFLIENCIYGVDIQQIAIQISKLRFFIALIVDQKVNDDKPNRNILSMPNLETKFVAANTLIGLDKPQQMNLMAGDVERLEKELASIRHKIFFTRKYSAKKVLKKTEKSKREELQKALENSGYTKNVAGQMAGWNPFDPMQSAKFFDPETMFGFKDGFDIVIGNPPYKVVKKEEQYQYKGYSTVNCGDLYAYFIEKSLTDFIKAYGSLAFITASLFIKGLKFDTLRVFLEKNLKLQFLEIQGDKVFENVQMPTAVIIGQKSNVKNNNWSFEDIVPNNILLKKIEKDTKPLSNVSAIMRGFEIGRDQVTSSGDVKFITGSDVSKWGVTKLSYITKRTESQFMKDEQYFKGERILIRETGNELTVLYLDNKLYCNRSLYSIKVTNRKLETKYISALLNSKLFQFYYISKFKSETDLFPKIRIAQVKLLPVKLIKQQQPFITLVDKILTSKKANPKADTSALEKQIDEMVYKLYDLTDEEIKIIEGNE
jgi:adenine-specific DNA-methyltransferase